MTRLLGATWDEAGRGGSLVVPIGSTEQHGPHLPLGTDGFIAEELVARFERLRPDAWIAPTIWISAAAEHAGFPGTLSIGSGTFLDSVMELARSADHFDRLIVANWHGGNLETLAVASDLLRKEGRTLSVWAPDPTESFEAKDEFRADLHAGWIETSMMLVIDPELVRSDRAEPGPETDSSLGGRLKAAGVKAVSKNGVLGDPRYADASTGELLLDELTADLVRFYDG